MHAFAKYAHHGVAAFVIVLPRGRITSEHEEALRRINRVFGSDISKHAVIAVTHAMTPGPNSSLMTREMILEEVDKLPENHFLRELVEKVNYRVVGVENYLEPHKSISQVLLNQAVLDVLEHNGGKTFDVTPIFDDSYESVFSAYEGSSSQCTIIKQLDKQNKKKGLQIMCKQGSDIPDMLFKFLRATKSCTVE